MALYLCFNIDSIFWGFGVIIFEMLNSNAMLFLLRSDNWSTFQAIMLKHSIPQQADVSIRTNYVLQSRRSCPQRRRKLGSGHFGEIKELVRLAVKTTFLQTRVRSAWRSRSVYVSINGLGYWSIEDILLPLNMSLLTDFKNLQNYITPKAESTIRAKRYCRLRNALF